MSSQGPARKSSQLRRGSQASSTGRGSHTVAWNEETEERLLPEESNDDVRRGVTVESLHHEESSFSLPDASGTWYERISSDTSCCKVLSCFDRFVIVESSRFRKVWEMLLLVMLLYIGIVFPFRLAFFQFQLNDNEGHGQACKAHHEDPFWENLEKVITHFFWVDLFLNFVLTYRREDDKEEYRFVPIAMHYLSGEFWLNMVACLPPEVFQPIVAMLNIDPGGCSSQSTGAGSVNQIARFSRLQRITRLARLATLLRLFKITSFMRKSSLAKAMNEYRTWRMINLVATLCWVVHLLACGWFLCAALHTDHKETWVGRREIDTKDQPTTLLGQNAWLQWAHAMYFILTVFTSVGFGDMHAQTAGEIPYVCFVMLVGAVVHSIIISEMINLVSEVDEETKWRRDQKNLFEGFSKHAWLQDETMDSLVDSVNDMEMGKSFDREKMRKFIVSGLMPPKLLADIPEQLFDGLLIRNRFLRNCGTAAHDGKIPVRFTLLMSTMLTPMRYGAGEVVFQVNDHAFNMYFVLAGTFAYVADPGENGGVDSVLHTANVAKLSSQKKIVCKCEPDIGGGTASQGFVPRSSGNESMMLAGLDFRAMLSRREEEKDESVIRIDPPESERDYSSGGVAGGETSSIALGFANPTQRRPFSSMLGQQVSAWTVGPYPGQWMQMDLGSVKSVCGVIIQGHPSKEERVTKIKVSVAHHERQAQKVVCEAEFDVEDNDTIVEIEFGKSLHARIVRIEPLEWTGSQISMRAGVLVTQQNLYPYMFFGKNEYFGEQILRGGMRPATMRCEASGQLLLLHKGDIVPGNNGDGLLSEFPQFKGVLLAELSRREAKRRRMLKKLTREWKRPSYMHYAAAIIQRWYRELLSGSVSPGLKSYQEEATKSVAEEVHKGNPDGDPRLAMHQLESKVDKLQTDVTELREELRHGLAEMNSNFKAFFAGVQREQTTSNVRDQPSGSAKAKHNKMP